jgi:hypothetical protein
MFDTFNMEFHNKAKCNELILNFIREIPYGEAVSIIKISDSENESYEFAFVKNDEKQILFRGRLIFKTVSEVFQK